ncbi:MAG: hypothetical protein UT26_C0001G0011 [Microgenomates group bacterium GW2011_GWC1_39_12]|nr:MAG: hypothetical protein UT26_C0001G0011 [Microgenomates group bacterium GW2011_GWC1_39_12]
MKQKTVAILQSNYIPWKGYFNIIKESDLFIFHDDLQYTKQDWRNRNKIKTSHGIQWLTIPCGTNEHRKICDVMIVDDGWQKTHWNNIYNAYHQAPYFRSYAPFFEQVYLHIRWHNLSALNQYVIQYLAREFLDITTRFDDSRIYNLKENKEKRVLELLTAVHATKYISGPAAKSYIHEDLFTKRGITIHWMNYSHYKQYPQFYPPFEHAVSIIDLLFHVGPKAKDYI